MEEGQGAWRRIKNCGGGLRSVGRVRDLGGGLRTVEKG